MNGVNQTKQVVQTDGHVTVYQPPKTPYKMAKTKMFGENRLTKKAPDAIRLPNMQTGRQPNRLTSPPANGPARKISLVPYFHALAQLGKS